MFDNIIEWTLIFSALTILLGIAFTALAIAATLFVELNRSAKRRKSR